jgi:hypothetical protein
VATFQVPPGWTAKTNFQYDPYAWGVAPKTSPDAPKCSIDLHYYVLDADQLGDQQVQADSYLDGIHRHNDEEVSMHITDTFDSRAYGQLHVYRYFSDYWRDRRAVFIVRGNRYVHVELYAHESADGQRCQATLEEVARSVLIR